MSNQETFSFEGTTVDSLHEQIKTTLIDKTYYIESHSYSVCCDPSSVTGKMYYVFVVAHRLELNYC